MFYACAVILTVATLFAYSAHGPRMAIALCWAGGLLTPSWVYVSIGPLDFDLHMYGAILALVIGFCNGKVLIGGWVWLDGCVVALVAAQYITEALCDNLKIGTIIGGCVEWLLPYFLGRIAFQSLSDLRTLTKVGAWLCLLLAGWSLCESITRVNPMSLFLHHQGSYNAEADVRWGLRRAEGPTTHPIYFGLLLVMMLPWAFSAADEARHNGGAKWWRALPWLTLLGVFFTMSRGPQLAACIALLLLMLIRCPAWRMYLAVGTTAVAGLVFLTASSLMDGLHAWAGEGAERIVISIKGQTYEYSGTNHRFLQLLVYEDAAREAGWFGYGIVSLQATSNILPVESGIPSIFRSIDNHYLLHVLRSGHLGLALFLLTVVFAAGRLLRPALTLDSTYSLLAAGLFSSLVAVLLVITTVWLSQDFGTLLLFGLGLSVSLRSCFDGAHHSLLPPSLPERQAAGPSARPSARPSAVRPRLVPGHPLQASSVPSPEVLHGRANLFGMSIYSSAVWC